MDITIKLVSRFLNYEDVCSLVIANDANLNEILNFYFKETMYLTSEDYENILNNTIPQPLWMRMYCKDLLLKTIQDNEFMSQSFKEKIYTGVKDNIPSLLKIYNEYYYLAVGESIDFFADIKQMTDYLPLKIDRYELIVNSMGEFIIKYDGKCIGRNFLGDNIKIIKHYGLEHILTILKSPLILQTISIYNKDYECCLEKRFNEHRRPKIRRRTFAVDM